MSLFHGSFTLERHYPVPTERVFRAFADPATKRRWFAEGEAWTVESYALDLRPGGRESSRFRFRGGPPITNETVVHDVVEGERIVTSYAMAVDGRPISVSLQTVQLEQDASRTRLSLTEQGVYFDDPDALANREAGTSTLLDALAKELDPAPA